MEMETAYKFTNDMWQFYKKYGAVQTSESYWDEVVKSAEALHGRYGSNSTMHKIILDVLDALEEEGIKRDEDRREVHGVSEEMP